MVLDATCGNGSVAKILRATRRGDRTVVTNDIDPAHEADYHLDAAQPQLYDTLAAIYDAVDWVVFNPPHEQPICLQVINMAIERGTLRRVCPVAHELPRAAQGGPPWRVARTTSNATPLLLIPPA